MAKFLSTLIFLVPPLFILPIALAAEEITGINQVYVTASTANLRESPYPSAPITRKLGIASLLEIERYHEGWLEVSTVEKGYRGYIHESLVSSEKPTLELALRKFEEDPPGSRDRLRWAERAAALAPKNTEVLSRLAMELARAGKFSQANSIREESLRIDGEFDTSSGWNAIFAYNGYGVETVALYKKGAFIDPDRTEKNYRTNLKLFHKQGNQYNLLTNLGPSGKLTVLRNAPGTRFDEYGNCLLDTSAKTSKKLTIDEQEITYGIATNFPPTAPYPKYYSLDDQSVIDEISTLAKSNFDENLWEDDLRRYSKSELKKLKESQNIVSIGRTDLDSDGTDEYVLAATYKFQSSPELDLEAAYSALYLLRKSNNRWRIEFVDFSGGGGDAISHSVAYKGHIDIDGDGTQEFFVYREHYEGSSIMMIKNINGEWKTTSIGSYTGC